MEFGLLLPLLVMVLFGIVDYGLWFNDSLNVRQGVREAARQGVVNNFSCTGASNMERLACQTRQSIGAVTGPTYVKIVVPPTGWQRGEPLLVCGMVQAGALTGIVPLPADGLIKSSTTMSIEAVSSGQTESSYEDAAPPGGDWSWCA